MTSSPLTTKSTGASPVSPRRVHGAPSSPTTISSIEPPALSCPCARGGRRPRTATPVRATERERGGKVTNGRTVPTDWAPPRLADAAAAAALFLSASPVWPRPHGSRRGSEGDFAGGARGEPDQRQCGSGYLPIHDLLGEPTCRSATGCWLV
ncbi:hypothetical protein PVAP13_9KG032395 [Panicum virgatum]|uniref:Uncharacterized protein n=1 Tax=Panicum virgatum TaxID=38727 RepID=A0A8T0ND63_PANVG|nr:hypothetical protein PVAP13_9KG032395 [Panicum virgatum]